MAYTYSKLATYTVGSGGITNISFLNIPQNYTDLVIKISTRAESNGDTFASVNVTFNNSISTYTNLRAYGSGATRGSSSDGTSSIFAKYGINGSAATASTFGNFEIYIPNYASSYYKSVLLDSVTENNAAEAWAVLGAGLWSTTSAITSIKLEPIYGTTQNFAQYSTATLYGIKAEV